MKRFYKQAGLDARSGGFAVVLDGRPVRTPGKALLIIPNETAAQTVAAEWQAQGDRVDPGTMPFSRFANTAIDRVAARRAEVIDEIVAYGNSDLLCYRAEGPESLVKRQAVVYDPLLDWLAQAYNARLAVTTGLIHVPQDPEALACIHKAVAEFDNFRLACLHTVVTVTGSIVIGLALAARRLTAEEASAAGTVHERFQSELWGEDAEALERLKNRTLEVSQAARFMSFF